MSDPSPGIRFSIRGKVQGVFFRAETAKQARRLGITGSARNLPDGSVEVVAFGTPSAIEELARWLWTGSPGSRVDGVEAATYDGRASDSFDVL